jgi:nucleotide-binding universal stress UspA family protein
LSRINVGSAREWDDCLNNSTEAVMSYKSICVGLVRGDARNDTTMKAAIGLAARFDAHMSGALLVPPLNIPIYAAVPLPDDLITNYYEDADRDAEELRTAFEAECRAEGVGSVEWHGATKLVLRGLEEIAPMSDLLVLAQHTGGDFSWLVGEASLVAGTPILAVPEAGSFEAFGKSILLPWTPRRECTRADRDAMPMLQAADRVVVFRGNADDDGRDVELGAHLARHGVSAEIKHVAVRDVSIGDAILNTVTDESCDMIVMCAYGHSRFREVAFGGVTRHVLQHMTVPTLLSH